MGYYNSLCAATRIPIIEDEKVVGLLANEKQFLSNYMEQYSGPFQSVNVFSQIFIGIYDDCGGIKDIECDKRLLVLIKQKAWDKIQKAKLRTSISEYSFDSDLIDYVSKRKEDWTLTVEEIGMIDKFLFYLALNNLPLIKSVSGQDLLFDAYELNLGLMQDAIEELKELCVCKKCKSLSPYPLDNLDSLCFNCRNSTT